MNDKVFIGLLGGLSGVATYFMWGPEAIIPTMIGLFVTGMTYAYMTSKEKDNGKKD